MQQNYFSKLSNRLWVSLILTLTTTFSFAQSNQFYAIMPCIDKCETVNPIPGYPTVLVDDDISVSGTNLNMLNDATVDIPIGNFNFNFYCQKMTSLRVGADGAMLVNAPSVNLPNRNNVPGGGANRGLASLAEYIIAPYWDELNLIPNVSSVRWERKSSPDRIVVQWNNVSVKPIGSTEITDNLIMTFRVVLFANSSDIVYFYKDTELESKSTGGINFDIAAQYQFGLDASVGLRSPCATGRRGDKVNNVVFNNPGDGVSLKAPDPDTCRLYRAYVFQPKTNCADIFAKDSTIAPVCVGSPAIQINPSGPAINGVWKGVGTTFLSTQVLQNPKFNPTTAGTYTLMWNAGDRCAYNYNIKLKVDEKVAAVVNAVPEQCGSARFQLTAQEPRLLDGSLAVGTWRIVSGSGTITPTGSTAVVNGVGTSVPTVVEWKVTNGACETVTTVTLKNRAAPVAIAGSNINQCVSNIFKMKAVGAAVGSTGTWSVISGNATIEDPSNPLTNVTITSGTTAVLRWTVRYDDAQTCLSFGNVTLTNDEPAAAAGPDRRACKTRLFALGGTAPTGNTTGMWTVKSGDVIISDPKNPNTTVQMVTGITATLIWTVSVTGDTACNATDELVLFLDDPIANAGQDQNKCQLNTFNLDANVAPLGMTGRWSVVGGTAVIADINNPKTSATLNGGAMSATLRWTVTVNANQFCAAFDEVVIINNTPQSAAGPDLRLCNERIFQLGGSNPGVLASGKWVVITGDVTFTNDTLFNTKATVNTGNIAQIEWVVTSKFDPRCSAKSQITLRVDEPKANAGLDQTSCKIRTFTTAANATPLGMTGKWTLVNGKGTIANANNSITSVTIDSGSTIQLRWTVSVDDNKTCLATDDVIFTTIDVASSAGPDARQCNNRTFVLGAGDVPVGTTGKWTIVNGDVLLSDDTKPNSMAVIRTGNVATLKWTLSITSNADCNASDEITLRVDEPRANAGMDQTKCQIRNFTTAANTPSVLEAGKWTLVSGKGTIADVSNPITGITIDSGSTITLRWTITINDNKACFSTDDVVLTTIDVASSAGPDLRQCNNRTFVLGAGDVPVGTTGKWTIVNGDVLLSDDTKPNSMAVIRTGNIATLKWTLSITGNADCNASDEITLRVDEPKANAGRDISNCQDRNFTMAANVAPLGMTGKWTLINGDATIADASNPLTSVKINTNSTATLLWTVTVDDNKTCFATDNIVLTVIDVQSSAGPDLRQCKDRTFVMSAQAAGSGTIGTWTVVSGDVTINSASSPTTIAILNSGTIASLKWTLTLVADPTCQASDEVTLRLDEPVAAAGDDIRNCQTRNFTLAANTPSVLEIGKWTVVEGNATIANDVLNNTTVSVNSGATAKLRWTVSIKDNPNCTAFDDIVLFVDEAQSTAGTTIRQCKERVFVMKATAPPTGFTGKWTVKNGNVTIVNDVSPTTLVRLVSGSTATLVWSVSVNANPTCNAASEVTIQVDEPVANAGKDFRLCRIRNFTMAATTPINGSTGKWSLSSGDATIIDPNSPTTEVTLNTGKTATLRWSVSINDNPTCISTDDAIITTEEPQANAGIDQRQCQNSIFTLAATATASGSTGSWSTVSGPIRFSNITSLNSTATLTTNKTATARWTVAITGLESCRAFDDVNLTSDEPVVATIDPIANNCENSTFNLVANTPSVGTGIWSIKSGSATISDVKSPTITVTNIALESPVVLTWTVTEAGNPCGIGVANITITNFVKNRVVFVKDTVSNCTSKTDIILSSLGTITGSATKNGIWKALKGGNTTTVFGKFVDINGIETNIWSKAFKYIPSIQEQIRGEVVLELCPDANGVCVSKCETVVIKLAAPGLTCEDKLNLTPITLLYPTCKTVFDSSNIIKNKDYKYYTIKITDAKGNPLVGNIITSDYIGSYINVTLTDACTTISCQINILGQTPTIDCPNDVTLNCGQLATNALPPLSMTGDLGLDIYPSDVLTAKAQGAKDGSIIGCARQFSENYTDKVFKSCYDAYTISSIPSIAQLIKDLDVSPTEAANLFNRIKATVAANANVYRIIARRFTLTYGNNGETTAPCFQLIFAQGLYWDVNLIVCPKDTLVDCTGKGDLCSNDISKSIDFDYAVSPFYYDADTSGTFTVRDIRFGLNNIPACNILITVKDSTQALCKGSYNLLRSFTIEDICLGNKKQCNQKVEVMDYQQPIVLATFPIIKKVKQPFCYVDRWNQSKNLNGVDIAVGTDTSFFDGYIKRKACNVQVAGNIDTAYALSNSIDCGGRVQIKLLACDPLCSNDLVKINANDTRYKLLSTKKITDAKGGVSFEYVYEAAYEEIGEYDVVFTADDDCGFASALKTFHIIVEDNAKPSFACVQSHTASIGTDGTVRIEAKTFLRDYWKSDNCSVDYVFARRMDGKRCTPSVCEQKETDTDCFKEFIDFGCCDVGNTDTVIVRVVDGNGNYNDCMVIVKTDDKIKPICVGPKSVEIPCFETINGKRVNISEKLLNPERWFGTVQTFDNCGEPQITHTMTAVLDNCSIGTITRKWIVRDCKGENPITCTQIITTKTQSDFSVDFPDDVTLSCAAAIPSADVLKAQMLNPNSWAQGKDGAIKNDGCSVVSISIKDTEAMNQSGCKVIYRKITVYDDCKHNPNNDLVDQDANAYGLPLCGDAHSNPNWANINEPAWQNIRKLGCVTTPRERRFRDADATILEGEGNPLGPLNDPINPLHPYSFADGVICFIQTIKVIDETKPTLETKADKVICSTKQDLKCVVAFRDTLKATDVCGGVKNTEGLAYNWTLLKTGNQGKNNDVSIVSSGKTPFISEILEYGTYQINWSVKDLCGNVSDVQSYKITLKDCQAPFVLAHNKVAELGGVNGRGMAQICVSDVLNNVNDDCTDSMYLDSQLVLVRASDNPNNTYPSNPQRCLMLTCTDAGKDVILQLWTRDKAGNANFVNATISVQSNLNLCPITIIPAPIVTAQLSTEKNYFVKNATVTALSSGSIINSGITNTEGVAQFDNLPLNNNYDIKAEKTDEPYLGVTTLDISLISRHILDIDKLKTPYSIIAADVNGNGEVDGADMIILRNFILRKINVLPSAVWRFVDKNYTFQNPTAPFSEDYPQVVSLKNLTENQKVAFVAIKVGDVNGTYRPASLTGSSAGITNRSSNNWTLTTDDIAVEKGKNYTVKIKTNSLKAASFQFTLAFVEGSAQVKTVEAGNVPNLSSGNFGVFQNAITTSWNGKADISETELFSLSFTAQQTGKLSDILRLNSELTPSEASNAEGVALNTQLQFANSKSSIEKGEFALYQNRPNPTRNTTSIGFNLPKDSDATLVIYNLEGKVVKTVKGTYKGGFNEISVSKSDIGAVGVFYYRLETSDFSATKKMVIIE
jgi:Dockerin type I domain